MKEINKGNVFFKIRQLLRDVYLRVVGSISKPANAIHIISGHVSHRTVPDIKYMEQTMKKLSRIVRFIRIEDAIRMIEDHEQPQEPLCAFTFDDGFDDCYYYIAPVLEKYNTNAMFFVNPNFIEGDDNYVKHFTEKTTLTPGKKPMRWDQLIDLQKRGFLIGAHTMDHFLTASNNKAELEYQIGQCKSIIEKKLGTNCDWFAWPYGRLEHTNIDAVKIACKHYKYVFSQTDYKHYYSFDGKVINRRHFEPFWPFSHIKYFISKHKQY